MCVAVHGAYEYVKLLGRHKRYVKLLMEDGSRTKFSVGDGSKRVNPASDITWEQIFKNAAFFFPPDLDDTGSQAKFTIFQNYFIVTVIKSYIYICLGPDVPGKTMGFKISSLACQELEILITAEMGKLSCSRENLLQDDDVMSELLLEAAIGDFKRDISGNVIVFDNNALDEPELVKLSNLGIWTPLNPSPDHVLDECYEDRLVRYRLKPNGSKKSPAAGGGSVAKPRNRTSFSATPTSSSHDSSSSSDSASLSSASISYAPFEVNKNDPEIAHIDEEFHKQIEELQNAYRVHISQHITQREREAQAKRLEEVAEQERYQAYIANYKPSAPVIVPTVPTVPVIVAAASSVTNSNDVGVIAAPAPETITEIGVDSTAINVVESQATSKKESGRK